MQGGLLSTDLFCLPTGFSHLFQFPDLRGGPIGGDRLIAKTALQWHNGESQSEVGRFVHFSVKQAGMER